MFWDREYREKNFYSKFFCRDGYKEWKVFFYMLGRKNSVEVSGLEEKIVLWWCFGDNAEVINKLVGFI